MRNRIFTLFVVAMIAPMFATVTSAQDDSYIVVGGSAAIAIDENYDGELDLVRVIASIGTTAPTASVAVEVIANDDDMTISFWNNTTVNYGDSLIINSTVKAWSDGEYHIMLRVWDLESGLLTYEEDLGVHELMASLTPPQLEMTLESEDWILADPLELSHPGDGEMAVLKEHPATLFAGLFDKPRCLGPLPLPKGNRLKLLLHPLLRREGEHVRDVGQGVRRGEGRHHLAGVPG